MPKKITYTDEVPLDFGLPCEKTIGRKLNPFYHGDGDDDFTLEEYKKLSEDDLRLRFDWLQKRDELQSGNPIEYGYTMERWRAVMKEWKDYTAHVVYGGNRSSKSTFAAAVAVYLAMTIPGAEIVCWTVDETASETDQQRFIYEALPKAYRHMKKTKGKMYSVQYSQKNGFSGQKLIIPSIHDKGDPDSRGSTILFKNYRSYALNPQVAEGWKAHFVWLDEECPSTLFGTMRKRLWDYRGRLFLTFTTLQGWTALINNINSKANTTEQRWAEKAKPPRMIPYEQLSVNEDKCKIWHFWTQDNPFIPWEEAVEEVSKKDDAEIMARLYGVCVKSMKTKFPKFSRKVHVVKHEELPWIENPDLLVTRYQTLDPAGTKKWFFIYAGVVKGIDDDMPDIYIYDEFPDWSYGPWGLEDDSPKGKRGEGMEGTGIGLKTYVSMMHQMEEDGEVFERAVDKRFSKGTRTGLEGDTRLIEELLLLGMRYITPITKKVDGVNEIELGCQAINSYLDYEEKMEVDSINRPHLYISERCLNLIECVENFTGEGGTTEVWKDGIDCLRILLDINPRVVDWAALIPQKRVARGY